MPTSPDFATPEDFSRLGYTSTGYEDLVAKKLHEVSEQLRSEAKNRNYNIDGRFDFDKDWAEAVKSAVCKIVQNIIYSRQDQDAQIGTEYEGIESFSFSSSANGYGESKTIKLKNNAELSTSYIPKNVLSLLGISAQKIGRENF